MAFHVRDEATDAAVRRLARATGLTMTEAIRVAVEHELAAITNRPSMVDRLRAIQADFQAMRKPGGLPADKAFFDDLSGDI